jgi:hypothetical protein
MVTGRSLDVELNVRRRLYETARLEKTARADQSNK